MQKKESHTLIIGAGVAGLAAAYYLQKTGRQVTVFDKTSGANNCSHGNAGLIAPRHIIPLASPGVITTGLGWMLKKESPFYIKPRLNKNLIQWLWLFKKAATAKRVKAAGPLLRDLLFRNQDLLIQLEEEESLEFNFHKNGHLTLCETVLGLESQAKNALIAQKLGVPTEILTPEEVWKMDPNAPKNISGAVYYPKDAHLYPNELMDGLLDLLKKKGVNFEINTEITSIHEIAEGGVEITSASGQNFTGSELVLCAGSWTPNLTKNLDVNIPVQAGKGYSITLKNPPHLSSYNYLIAEKKVAITPMGDHMRFAGTMEIVGLDKSITPAKVNALKKSILEYYPEYRMEDLDKEEVWVGLRPCSPDGLPYIGKLKHYQNIYISTGYSMVGMSLGFAGGEMIGQLITTGEAELSDQLIDPNRYNPS